MNDAEFAALRMQVYDEVRSLSLTDFLERELEVKPIKSGKSIRFSSCPHCGEGPIDSVRLAIMPGDSHYKCHRCGEPGDILVAAEALWLKSNWECALKLTGRSNVEMPKLQKRVVRPQDEVDQEAQLRASNLHEALVKIHQATLSHRDEETCLDYLCIGRGLSEEVVREAQRRKMLGFMPRDPKQANSLLLDAVGEPLLKASGLWKAGSKVPAIIFRPIVFFLPGFDSAEFRIVGDAQVGELKSIRYGVSQWPYVWRNGDTKRAMIVEGFIDFLSSVDLGYAGHVVGLPGAGCWTPEWFEKVAKVLGIENWIIALDQDDDEGVVYEDDKEMREKNPGQYWAMRLKKALDELHHQYIHKAPPQHSDINDILRARKAA